MAIRLGSNISSLTAQRNLAESSSRLAKSFQRISSGQRINTASDDAAGLAVSLGLNTQVRIKTQAVRNINDGLSVLSISSSALDSLGNISIRQKELAEQAANGNYSSTQRQALNNEAAALTQEYSRVLATTKFNGINLYQTSGVSINIQAGEGASANLTTTFGSGLGAPQPEVSTIDFANTVNSGAKETTQIYLGSTVTGGEPGYIYAVPGINDISGGDYVTFGYNDSSYYVWFTVDGSGSDPGAPGTGFNVSINSSDDTIQVMDAVSAVLSGNSISNTRLSQGIEFVVINSSVFTDQENPVAHSSGSFIQAYASGSGESNYEGEYFSLTDGNSQNFYVYYGTDPGIGGATGISVNIAVGDTQDQLADKTIAALQATGSFTGVNLGGGLFNIYNTVAGNVTNSTAHDPQSKGTLFLNSTSDGRLLQSGQNYFTFSTSSADYYAWFNDGASGNPNLSGKTGIQVTGTLTSPSALAARAKIAIDAALPSAGISVQVSGSSLTITNSSNGERNDATSGVAGVTFSIQQGSQGGIDPETLDLTSVSGARSALTTLDSRLSRISSERAQQGAFESRLITASKVLQSSIENYSAAESRIKDVDIAEEAAKQVRENILQQVGAAILSQANQAPNLALTLLKG